MDEISLVLHNAIFIEHYLLDKIAFYLKLSAKVLLQLLQLAHNHVLVWPSSFCKIVGTELPWYNLNVKILTQSKRRGLEHSSAFHMSPKSPKSTTTEDNVGSM